jgi:hypothetical protein
MNIYMYHTVHMCRMSFMYTFMYHNVHICRMYT